MFVGPPMFVEAKFFLASFGFSCDTCKVCVMRSGKMAEKCKGKSGNSNRTDRWEP